MSAQAQATPKKAGVGGSIFLWISGIMSFSLLGYFFLQVTQQIIIPPPASRLVLVQDVPLPDGLFPNAQNPLAPGVEEMFDGFDFQAYDAATHHLFIAHTGPGPDLLTQAKIKFDPKNDGNIVVFDTQLNQVIARLPITQVSGVIDAPDLHKVFASGVDPDDNGLDSVFDIDTDTLQFHVIHLTLNESPDALTYDSVDHRIFVSNPGAPPDVTGPQNPDRHLMDVAVINALNDQVIQRINFGLLPLLSGETAPTNPANIPAYGHDVGH
ncbi:MAG: YncE family protein, partial [Ktedonobacteraceae bacterium]